MASIITNYVAPVRKAKAVSSGKNKERANLYESLLSAMLERDDRTAAFGLDESDNAMTLRLGFVKFAATRGHVVKPIRRVKGDSTLGFVIVGECAVKAPAKRGRKASVKNTVAAKPVKAVKGAR
jgi:hypothetical protein